MGRLFAFWDEIPAQRKKRIALFVLAIAIVGATVWAARSVLGLYFVGLVLAYLLSPIVDAIQRGIEWVADKIRFGFLRRMARSLGIVIAYILLVAVIAGFFALVVPLVAREAQQLWEARDSIYVEISDWVEGALAQYELLPDRVRQQIDDALRNLS
ncbi:MAG: AI-2E family transporter, partial [Anaerolineae bacterium]